MRKWFPSDSRFKHEKKELIADTAMKGIQHTGLKYLS